MRYRDPIDDTQWSEAARLHTKLRSHLATLRKHFAPQNPEQQSLLNSYRQVIQNLAKLLLGPRNFITASRLNDISEKSVRASVS